MKTSFRYRSLYDHSQSAVLALTCWFGSSILLLIPGSAFGQQRNYVNMVASAGAADISLLLQPQANAYYLQELNFLVKQQLAKKAELNLDTVVTYGEMMIDLYQREALPKGLAKTYIMLGQAHSFKNDMASARQNYRLAIRSAITADDSTLLAKAFMMHGWSFIYGNQYDTAIAYTVKAIAIAEKIDRTDLLISIYRNLPRIYYLAQDYLKSYKASVALVEISHLVNDCESRIYGIHLVSELYGEMNLQDKQMQTVASLLQQASYTNDTACLYTIYNTAYTGYLNSDKNDSALYYATLLLPLAEKLRKKNVAIDKIAKAHLELGHLDTARYYYEMSLSYHQRNRNYIDTYKYLDLGKIEFASGNYHKALQYYKQAEAEISRPSPLTKRRIYKALYDYYDHFRQYEVANRYLEAYDAMSDTIQSIQAGIGFLAHEEALLKGEIELLSKDNELQAALMYRQKMQNRLAYGGTVFILVFAGVAFYRFKRQRELQNKEALANERLRISHDLHDEVGSALSGIAMYTHVAQQQVKNRELNEVERSLLIMQGSAREMISKLSDIVWLINPELDTIAELFDRLEQYAMHMTRAKNMRVQISLPEKFADIHIPLDARRNIYLFCKEAINNAVKYSGGSQLHLQVKQDQEGMRFAVADDGKGFDEITIRKGNGLRNMRKRAEEIGALAEFAFGKGKGTKVEMYYKMAS